MHTPSTASDRAMLQLLRAGLYDDPSLLEGFAGLTPSQWETLYVQAKRQTVSGIICHALAMLPDSLLPPYGLLLRWVARAHSIETSYSRMSRALSSLLELFAAAGLRPVLQKGHGVARFYSTPTLRVCGDIDLYFPEEQQQQADAIIASHGISLHRAPDGSTCYLWQGVEVEHHSSLIQLHSPFRRNALSRLLASEATVDINVGASLPAAVLTPLAELLMINVHIMKHSLGAGIGLRHFCDYSLAYAALIPAIGMERYKEACRSLGILRWTDVLHSFINAILPSAGAPLPVLGREASADALRRLGSLVMEGGNFGLYRHSSDRISRNAWSRKFGTFFSFLRHSGFTVRIAPGEALWMIMKLTRGQLHV